MHLSHNLPDDGPVRVADARQCRKLVALAVDLIDGVCGTSRQQLNASYLEQVDSRELLDGDDV